MSETEFAMLLLGVGVLAVAVGRINTIRRLHHWQLAALSYCFLLAGWSATTFELLFPHPLIGLGEHVAYAAGAVSAAAWCWLSPRDLVEAP